MIYGTAWKKDRTAWCVETAVFAGFRAIDTANQAKHYTESLVGEALKALAQKGISRDELFLQTKFTSRDGQDHRLPYDERADVKTQVLQSFESSLKHLGIQTLDSYLLHGPYNYPGLGQEDWDVWETLEQLHKEGRTKFIGISNVNAGQLSELIQNATVKPMVVQNRCFANLGWDREVRDLCRLHGIVYEAFSLLTANPFALEAPYITAIADRTGTTPAQVVFCFSRQIGMVPLTGTTDPTHMGQDLKALEFTLTEEEVTHIERLAL